jgi:amino acid permease
MKKDQEEIEMTTTNPLQKQNYADDGMPLYSPLTTTDEKVEDGEVNLEAALLNKASTFSCYVCLANTIMGAGILGLPYAFAKTGWLVGTILMFICASSSVFSLHELSVCAAMTAKPSSFYSVAMLAAPRWVWLIDAAVAIKCFGVATSYLIIIGGLMPEAMKQAGAASNIQDRHLWIGIALGIIGPVAFQNSLEVLKFTSTMSICFVSFVSVMIIVFAFPDSGVDPCGKVDVAAGEICVGDEFAVNSNSVEVLGALPIFVFAFTCHQNAFPVVNELVNPTQPRVDVVMISAIATAFSVFIVVAIAGFLTYGSEVASDVLQSYPDMPVTTVARICISLLVCFTYPLQCNPSRRSILNIWKFVDGNKDPSASVFRFRYILITVLFIALSFLIAFVLSDLGVMLALVGATGSTIVSYILPGGFYYALHKDDKEAPLWKTYAALAQLCVGILLIPTCLVFIFMGEASE